MKFFTFTVTFVFILFGLKESFAKHKYRKWKFQSCVVDNIDSCARVVFLYGNREVVLPDNEKDMVPHCNEEKSAVKCVYEWGRKCLKAFPRQALFMLMTGASKNIRERCAPAGTKWYLKNFNCVKDSLESQHKCMEEFTADIASIKANKDKGSWLPTACCFVDKWKKCFNEGAKPFCNEEGMRFLRWSCDAYVADLTDLACSATLRWNTTRCKQLNDVIVKNPLNSTEPKSKSILVPMYSLLNDFADWETVGLPDIKPAQ